MAYSFDGARSMIYQPHLNYFYGCAGDIDYDSRLLDRIQTGVFGVLNGDMMNHSEQRSVTHHRCRDPKYREQWGRLFDYSKSHAEKLSQIDSICLLGMGGSVTGPRAVCHALRTFGYERKYPIYFISNHDEDTLANMLASFRIESTLFLVVSKSGTTVETLRMLDAIIHAQKKSRAAFLATQCIAVTAAGSSLDNNEFFDVFSVDDSIGGRFSVTSPVGLLPMYLVFGEQVCHDFLDGAYSVDRIDFNADCLHDSISLSHTMLQFQYRKQYQSKTIAIVPYGEAFCWYGEYFVQLIAESLGKPVGIDSDNSQSASIMHGLGPNAQHGFFQFLHEHDQIVPTEFVYAKPIGKNQQHMLTQICGQMAALFDGRYESTGIRAPSTLLMLKSRTPCALGALMAVYENRVMMEGFALGINPFDQPGVELGKQLAKHVTIDGQALESQIYSSILAND